MRGSMEPCASSSEPLAPLAPSSFGAAEAAHLLRRAGFGGPPAQVERLAALGLERAVEELVDFPVEDPELELGIEGAGGDLAIDRPNPRDDGRDPLAVLRSWWIFRLAHARHPLCEKLTLFWHGHFATAASKVLRPEVLLEQNQALRRLGPGPFRELLGSQARSPAMLIYLDGRLNRAGAPNENWARELVELFTLGVDRYQQHDVTELARIFTGWSAPEPLYAEFEFDAAAHDAGDKVLFGVPLDGRGGPEGVVEGEEALDRIVERPECAQFLASKLLAAFASPAAPPEVRDALASTLRARRLAAREGLRVLFRSAWFYAPEQRFALWRGGVEQAIAAVRLLGVQNAHLLGLDRTLRRLGQDLFEPPSVAGWASGRAWVQTGALVERFRLARELSGLPHTQLAVNGSSAFDVESLAPADAGDEALVDHAMFNLLGRALDPAQRAALVGYTSDCGERHAADAPREVRRAKLRGLVHLCVAAPEFALA